MSKRIAIGNKLRFEVYKRDSFTCQYCGEIAPNVVLNIDHIHPLAKGGDNDITNLITSCFECNSGKKDRTLDDDTVVAKQHKQLEMLQERRQQIQYMFEWKKGLNSISENLVATICDYIESHIDGFSVNQSGKKVLSKLTKKFKLADILEAIDISSNRYLKYSGDSLDPESVENFFKKIGGIIVNMNKPPIDNKASYIKGICRNRFNYWSEAKGSVLMSGYIEALQYAGYSEKEILKDLEDELIPRTLESRNWSDWSGLLEGWTKSLMDKTREQEDCDDGYDGDAILTTDELKQFSGAIKQIGETFDEYDHVSFYKLIIKTIIDFVSDYRAFIEGIDKEEKPSALRHAYKITAPLRINSDVQLGMNYAIEGIIKVVLGDLEKRFEEKNSVVYCDAWLNDFLSKEDEINEYARQTLGIRCDSCGKPISNEKEGYVEWVIPIDDKGCGIGKKMRIVHRRSTPNYSECQYDQKELWAEGYRLNDLPLDCLIGDDGLMRLFQMIHRDEVSKDELLSIAKRIHIKGFDLAQPYFSEAITDNVIEPSESHECFSQNVIRQTVQYAYDKLKNH